MDLLSATMEFLIYYLLDKYLGVLKLLAPGQDPNTETDDKLKNNLVYRHYGINAIRKKLFIKHLCYYISTSLIVKLLSIYLSAVVSR